MRPRALHQVRTIMQHCPPYLVLANSTFFSSTQFYLFPSENCHERAAQLENGMRSPSQQQLHQPYEFSSPPEGERLRKLTSALKLDSSFDRASNANTNTNDSDCDIQIQSKVGVSVDLTSRDLRPLKSPVRLIGSPSLLNATIVQHLNPGGLPSSPPSLEIGSPSLSSRKKGFGRDRERRRREKEKATATTFDFVGGGAMEPPLSLKRSMSLESAKTQNAQLISLLGRSTTAATTNLAAVGAGIGSASSLIQDTAPERASTSMGVSGPFHSNANIGYNSDEGSLDNASLSVESMEFEPVSSGAGGQGSGFSHHVIIAPLSNAPMAGFKHRGSHNADNKIGVISGIPTAGVIRGSNASSKNNTSSSSPRYNNDSSMENSMDSMEGHAEAALEVGEARKHSKHLLCA